MNNGPVLFEKYCTDRFINKCILLVKTWKWFLSVNVFLIRIVLRDCTWLVDRQLRGCWSDWSVQWGCFDCIVMAHFTVSFLEAKRQIYVKRDMKTMVQLCSKNTTQIDWNYKLVYLATYGQDTIELQLEKLSPSLVTGSDKLRQPGEEAEEIRPNDQRVENEVRWTASWSGQCPEGSAQLLHWG